MPQIEDITFSRPELTLTDEHISIVNDRLAEFKAADLEARNRIIQKAAERIKRGWNEEVAFDRERIEGVSAFSAASCALNFSYAIPSAC